MKLNRFFTAALLITAGLCFTSCNFGNNSSSSSDSSGSSPDMSAPSLTCYSLSTGEIYFMTEVIVHQVGTPEIELWLYYNTDGSDNKIFYGELPSTRKLENMPSGKKYYFFIRKYCEGNFGPYSAKASVTVR